ncbi:ATP-dependent endonuclease [Photobacterium jeanii]|uniref:ATP-dependent endonuclease n=1 Tax=Photobacterium jeanii TaxID=858640 RepID=A0A178K4D9_9GAMM|nr:ATP-dependent endonuclease [Photobacterium jeanii]OAN11553.1 ATP-dependent endonuclease [Photobacterium jeanii]PST91075.1 ATP-dependent endonuclease [Photobacterium jeanii]
MHLERIEISGFRGIKRMSLTFDELTVLIGENAWGKSTLLDALSIALPPDASLYTFKFSDFHVDYAAGHEKMNQLHIVLHWYEDYPSEYKARRYRAFAPLWVKKDGMRHLYYQITSSIQDDKVITSRDFLNRKGERIQCDNTDKLVKQLMVLHPVVRIRDARRLRDTNLDLPAAKNQTNGSKSTAKNTGKESTKELRPTNGRIEKRLDNTCRRLMTKPGHVNAGEIKSSINALRSLVDHYFAFTPHNRSEKFNRAHFPSFSQYSTNPLEQLSHPQMTKQSRLVLMGLLNSYIRARGPVELKRISRPIMVLEDPEGRLHPTILHQAWAFIEKMPMQKILTTNSSELISIVPIHSIKKLIREPDKTQPHSLTPTTLSKDETRRVSFHIRLHRPSALFARAWLLVEGETEVWLFNELAQLCGYHFAAEGVHILEFAQSGLRPLIKVARCMGIEWHLVSDGDMAGRRYGDTVRSMLGNDAERHRLTVLPDRDIEHFLFNNGYEPLFRHLAKVPDDAPMPPKKIIHRALKRYAKPDVALAMVAYSDEHGQEKIPLLIRWILKRIVAMSRGLG